MSFKELCKQEVYLWQASVTGHLEFRRLRRAKQHGLADQLPGVRHRAQGVELRRAVREEPPAVPDEPEPECPDNIATDARLKNNYLKCQKMCQKMWQQKKAVNHWERCGVNYKV